MFIFEDVKKPAIDLSFGKKKEVLHWPEHI
jgi:hypothetical protein